jgi:hypothetical protein
MEESGAIVVHCTITARTVVELAIGVKNANDSFKYYHSIPFFSHLFKSHLKSEFFCLSWSLTLS